MPSSSESTAARPVVVCCSADERFALGLVALVRSLIDNLRPDRGLQLFVLDGGLRRWTRRRMVDSWDMDRARVEWIRPSDARIEQMVVSDWYTKAIYFRLLIPDVLPTSIRRAIYLDCDTIVMDDLGKLWDASLRGGAAGAVQDCGFGTISRGVPHYRSLGIPGSAKYFNSGVLLMDLARWRAQRIGERAIAYIRRRGDAIGLPDQEALNVVLARNWVELDPRWNGMVNARLFPIWKRTPYDKRTYMDLLGRPRIVHFVGGPKPWQPGCWHPRKFLYFHYLDRTRWAGWRPKPALPGAG